MGGWDTMVLWWWLSSYIIISSSPATHLNPFFSEFWRERLRDCRCGLARAVEDWFLDWDRDTEARDCDLEADLVGDSEASRDLEQRGVYTIWVG